MEVNQIIFFNITIYFNIFFSFFIYFFAIAVTFFLIKNNFVRLVLIYGYSCYLLPIYIIKDWQLDYYDHLTYLKIVILFFISVIFFYLLLNLLYKKSHIPIKSNNNHLINTKEKFLKFYKLILFLFYFFTFFLLYYFIILENSLYLKDDFLNIKNLRYLIYESDPIIQLIYVVYLRLLSVIIILIVPPKKILFLFFLIELIAIQSIERQSVFIVMAAVFARYLFERSFKNLSIFIVSIFFVMFVAYVQRYNLLGAPNLTGILYDYIVLIVNRVFLDPAQMLHLVYVKSEGLNFYLMNNRIIYLIVSSLYAVEPRGYSSIGIITDGYKIFSNSIGIIFASFWFAIILNFSAKLIQSTSNKQIKNILFVILFFSIIAFYYSNIFSIIPIFIIFSLPIIKRIFKF